MKYIKADLNYIFIRAKTPDGHWDNFSLNEITDKQFVEWAVKRFDIKIKDASDVIGKPWTAQQKIDFLNNISLRMGKPCVVMIRRGARKEWNKKLKK